jgi:hypothetical protein
MLFLGGLVLVVDHGDDFGLVAVGQQIVRGVDIVKTLLVVGPALAVDVLVFLLDFDGEDWHPVYQFLSVGRIVFGEVHVHEASQRMPVSSHPHVSVLVSHPIDNLFLQSSFLVSIALIGRTLGVDGVSAHNAVLLLCIELSHRSLLFVFDTSLVVFFQFSDILIMFLFKPNILSHYSVHTLFIHIHIDHLFSLLQGLIFIAKSQLF